MRTSVSLIAVPFLLLLVCSQVSCDRQESQVQEGQTAPEVTKVKRSGRNSVLSSRSEFESQLKAARQLADPAERDKTIAELTRQALESRPDFAKLAMIELSPESPEFQGLLNDCLGQLLLSDPESAIAWSSTIADERMSGIVREHLAGIIPDDQLGTAVNLMLDGGRIAGSGFKPGDEQILQRWAGVDPNAAAAWLSNVPMGASRDEGFLKVSRSLAHADSALAAGWLKAIPSQEMKTKAKEAIVDSLLETPEPIREALLGPPESDLRSELGDSLLRLQAPPEPEPIDEQPIEPPAEGDQPPEAGPEPEHAEP